MKFCELYAMVIRSHRVSLVRNHLIENGTTEAEWRNSLYNVLYLLIYVPTSWGTGSYNTCHPLIVDVLLYCINVVDFWGH